MTPRLSWESPSQQESLDKEGLYERGRQKAGSHRLEGFGGR